MISLQNGSSWFVVEASAHHLHLLDNRGFTVNTRLAIPRPSQSVVRILLQSYPTVSLQIRFPILSWWVRMNRPFFISIHAPPPLHISLVKVPFRCQYLFTSPSKTRFQCQYYIRTVKQLLIKMHLFFNYLRASTHPRISLQRGSLSMRVPDRVAQRPRRRQASA